MTWGNFGPNFLFDSPLYWSLRQNTTTTRYPYFDRKYGARKVQEERRAGQQPDERQVRQGKGRGHAEGQLQRGY